MFFFCRCVINEYIKYAPDMHINNADHTGSITLITAIPANIKITTAINFIF